MYRKSSPFNLALVLGALVLVTVVLSGCVVATPVTKPMPFPTCIPLVCDPPATCSVSWVRKVLAYIEEHYPEQAPQKMAWQETEGGWMDGNWTITSPDCTLYIVANDVTGFQWEGWAEWREVHSEGCDCRMGISVIERSVTTGKLKP